MSIKVKRLAAGRYLIGNTEVIKHRPIPGRQQTTTWKEAHTGKVLGYTLFEAKLLLARISAQEAQRAALEKYLRAHNEHQELWTDQTAQEGK